MSSTDYTLAACGVAYSCPEVRDLGSLAELTADFDINLAGSVFKLVTMAMVSAPLTGGGGGGPPVGGEAPPDGGGGAPVGGGASPDAGGGGAPVGGGASPDAGGGGTSEGGGASPDGGAGETLGDFAAGEGDLDGGGVAGDGRGASGTGGGSSGGGLPFTGYAAITVAALGAAFTTVGVAARAKLRRRSA